MDYFKCALLLLAWAKLHFYQQVIPMSFQRNFLPHKELPHAAACSISCHFCFLASLRSVLVSLCCTKWKPGISFGSHFALGRTKKNVSIASSKHSVKLGEFSNGLLLEFQYKTTSLLFQKRRSTLEIHFLKQT